MAGTTAAAGAGASGAGAATVKGADKPGAGVQQANAIGRHYGQIKELTQNERDLSGDFIKLSGCIAVLMKFPLDLQRHKSGKKVNLKFT